MLPASLDSALAVFTDCLAFIPQAAVANPALGPIICDHATQDKARKAATYEELSPLSLKGKQAAVRVWRVLQLQKRTQKGRRSQRLDSSAEHCTTVALVGRKAELFSIRDAVSGLLAGTPPMLPSACGQSYEKL